MITLNAHRRRHVRTRVVSSNPLKADPTRTATLRRLFQTAMRNRFFRLKGKILRLIVEEDAFGLKTRRTQTLGAFNEQTRNEIPETNGERKTTYGVDENSSSNAPPITENTRWAFRTDPQKAAEFRKWMQEQIDHGIIPPELDTESEEFWNQFVDDAYKKGGARAFDDTRKARPGGSADRFAGGREEFLRNSFARPQSVDKVKMLSGRVYTDLKGVTDAMGAQMSGIIVEGFAQGKGPLEIARQLNERVDKIGINRARTIARTEVIRAHAEGQLDVLEDMGVEEVGVAVEWSTAGDDRVCPRCLPMGNVVLKLKEARGMIPLHPNCRCAFIPANVGESKVGQKRSKSAIEKAKNGSIRADKPKLSLEEAKKASRLPTTDLKVDKLRPKSILDGPGVQRKSKVQKRFPGKTEGFKPDFKEHSSKEERSRITKLGGERSRLKKLIKAGGNDHLQGELDTVLAELNQIKALVKERINKGVGPTIPVTVEKKTVIKKPTIKPEIADKGVVETATEHRKLQAELKILNAEKKELDQVFSSSFPQTVEGTNDLVKHQERVKKVKELIEDVVGRIELVAKEVRIARQRHKPVLEVLEQKKFHVQREKLLKLAEEPVDEITVLRARQIIEEADQAKTQIKLNDELKLFQGADSGPIKDAHLEKMQIFHGDIQTHKGVIRDIGFDLRKAEEAQGERLIKSLAIPKKKQIKIKLNKSKQKLHIPGRPGKSLTSNSPIANKKIKESNNFVKGLVSEDAGIDDLELVVHRLPNGERAFAMEGDHRFSGVWMSEMADTRVYIHETAHHLEHNIFELRERATEFRNARIAKAGTENVKMIDVFPNSNYGIDEIGNPDDFIKMFGNNGGHYVGKDYGLNEATEIISMGVDKMYTDTLKFAKTDPEYFDFILGVLRGEL
jgi:SPP1 gp7 family putative phage head morphogenesis protein